jgi:hypothetical protein
MTMAATRGLYVTFAAAVLLAMALTLLLVRPFGALKPLRDATFELDEPQTASASPKQGDKARP